MNSRGDETDSGTGKRGVSRRTLVTLVTIAVLALAGVALYAAAGLWVAPRVVERELRTLAREDAGLDLAVETIAMNPFTLALSLGNVTLFRDENTPLAQIGRLESRITGVNIADRSLALRDVVIRSLAVLDRRGRPRLTVPRATLGRLVVGADAAPVAIGTPRLERPELQLRGDPGAWPELQDTIALLLAMPPADGDGTVTFEISGASAAFGAAAAPGHLRLGNIDGSIGRLGEGDDLAARASLRSRTPGIGTAQLTAEWLLHRPREKTSLELALTGFDLSVVSPWLASALGRTPVSGLADVDMQLEIEDSVLRLETAVAVENLRFAEGTGGGAASRADVATAIALLEDPGGRITLDLPALDRRLTGRTTALRIIASSLAAYLESLAASPFEYLARLVDWPGNQLGSLGFEAGSAEIGDETTAKLAALGRALALRPRLALTVFPALDEDADREALARQQIRLHVNLASSAGIPGEPAPEALDYDDLVVRDVLDEFAANRLSASRREALAGRHPERSVAYYRAVFEALVENEEVGMPTLLRLARYRAQAVAGALAAGENGRDRIRLAEEIVLAVPERGPEVTLEVRAPALEENGVEPIFERGRGAAARLPKIGSTPFSSTGVSPRRRCRPSGTGRR